MEELESIVNTTNDDVSQPRSKLPAILTLPPPTTGSSDDAAPSSTSKVPEYIYYDHIWVYSDLEAFKYVYSKEDFAIIYSLQRLDKITTLEKPEPITLSL